MKAHCYVDLEDKLHRLASDFIQSRSAAEDGFPDLLGDRRQLQEIVTRFLHQENQILSRHTAERVVQSVVNRITGLGPLQPLMEDPSISEIMVNSPKKIFVERQGSLEPVKASFRNQDHILNVIDRIVSPLGRRIDESVPFVDARLPDGSRVNAIIPPLALHSPALTIRRFSSKPFTLSRLVDLETLNIEMARFLQACVRAKINILISGGKGSGKTSTLNALARCIPDRERLVTIEDTAELQLAAENMVSLEARPPNIEGEGEVSIRSLVRNALRMRPDRIIVGEVRGPEAFDMLQAMNTGHPGSLTTVHANSAADAVRRLESMVLMAGLELPQPAIREQIASAVDIILQQERVSGGSRRITSISEILGRKKDPQDSFRVEAKEIFSFQRKGIDQQGNTVGSFQVTDYQPDCLERLHRYGCSPMEALEAE